MKQCSTFEKQQGATLIVGLIMLLLLTIIGMAAMNMTTVDVKVTANAKDRQLAFIGAESALFEAGQTIINTTNHPDTSTPGYVGGKFDTQGVDWWSNKANWNLLAVPGTSIASEYLIEAPELLWDDADASTCNIGPSCGKATGLFPTTVKSSGPGMAVVILQSYYGKQLDFSQAQ